MRSRKRKGGALGGVCAALVSAATLAGLACSTSSSNGSGNDAGAFDASCGPLPETLSVAGQTDCVAQVPDPCCAGFNAFSCAGGDGGGAQCSETSNCVRAARYDTPLCQGAQAYSCPVLNGQNYAVMTTPSCEQMEGVGPAGEGIRWCCGPNLPPVQSLDSGMPAQTPDSGPPPDAGRPPSDDAGTPPVKDAGPPPPKDSGPPPVDATTPPQDASPVADAQSD